MLWSETLQTPQVTFGWEHHSPTGEGLLAVPDAGGASDAPWFVVGCGRPGTGRSSLTRRRINPEQTT